MPQLTLTGEAQGPGPALAVQIIDDEIQGVSPEGERRAMKIGDWIARTAPARVDTCGSVLPDGVKCVIPIPKGAIYVHQTPPRVHRFQWIAADSPEPFGPKARYREVSLALPYLIVLAVFDELRGSVLRLGNQSEAFFVNRPLDARGLDTELCYPALLNCSRFPEGMPNRPLSWICVQHLATSAREPAERLDTSVRRGLGALLHHLLESGFNRSSEHHELSSWFSETVTAAVDERLATVEAWEAASGADPLFALDVPWLPTGHTLGQLAERIARQREPRERSLTVRDVLRVLFLKPSAEA